MIRLKDIAAQAGVSVMTVSKGLRDAPDISPATKARVRLLAEQLGYVPDSTAQGLRTRTTKLLGLVIPSITHPLYARSVLALEERVHQCGYELILAHSMNLPEREEIILRRCLARRVDGLFLFPVYRLAPSAPIYEELRRHRTPTVILGQCVPFCGDFPHVETDDLGGSYAAARHLLELGHRRIAFFAGPQPAPWAQLRLEGYRRALREAQLETADDLIFQAGSTLEEGEAAALQWLQESTRATAILAVSDLVAIGAANLLLNRGIRIPEDISIAGFGNIMAAEYFRVPLTTVRQPTYRQGNAAMDLMLQLLRGLPVQPQRIPSELIIRASTSPRKD